MRWGQLLDVRERRNGDGSYVPQGRACDCSCACTQTVVVRGVQVCDSCANNLHWSAAGKRFRRPKS